MRLVRFVSDRRDFILIHHLLSSVAAASSATGVSLSRSEAVLAIYGPVAPRHKWDGSRLPTTGTRNGCALRFASVSTPFALLVLLCLAARFAALRGRIPTLLEER